MALFEGYERKIDKINGVLAQYGLESVEACREMCKEAGFDPYEIVKGIQPIAFEDAAWSYCVGAAIALKKGVKNAAEAAEAIGIGLQAFCIPGSVAEDRKVGLGHGNLGAMLLRDETKCFAFLAGHESFAAAEGAIGIARSANKARKEPLRVILNGLGKDAAQIISRINGFTYVQTEFDFTENKLNVIKSKAYSDGEMRRVPVHFYTVAEKAMPIKAIAFDNDGNKAIATIRHLGNIDLNTGHNIPKAQGKGLGRLARGERPLELIERQKYT